MTEDFQKLIEAIKKQAEIFLLDAGEFFPFGTYIDTDDNIIPIAPTSRMQMTGLNQKM